MKKLVCISILIAGSVLSALAQSSCPTIFVTGSSSLTPIGDSITFTAKVEGIEFEKIKFEWTVDKGTITNGQGTSTINVATNVDIAGQTVTATVKISGLPQDCKNEATESSEVAAKPPRIIHDPKIDEYVKLSWRNEKIRLESIANELINNDKAMAYFIVYTNEKNTPNHLKSERLKLENISLRNSKFQKTESALFMQEKAITEPMFG
ncbi:MAG: hypothetical protein HC846_06250 [Blastocatellia bacterium]|nr:hypothetical protein [Blastocatellia bacterium]